MKLSELKPQQKAKAINCENSILPLKLMEMGCVDGVEIIFLNRAPLGSPYYYKIGDTRIALGKEIADLIEVEETENENGNEKI
jgi:ferrous iron transport protein A